MSMKSTKSTSDGDRSAGAPALLLRRGTRACRDVQDEDAAPLPGTRVISAVGGIGALECTGAATRVKLHALPATRPAIDANARHAWMLVFAHLIADALDTTEAQAIEQSRQLEARAFQIARECGAARGTLLLAAEDRARAEVTVYWSVCKRAHAALAENGTRLLARYRTAAVLVDLDAESLAEGTPVAACRAVMEAAAARAKRVLEDGGIKKAVVVGVERCRACRSFDVDVDFKQTRSADEPMTAFIACNACGARSKKN